MLQTQIYRPASLGRQLSILTSPSPATRLNDSTSQVSQVDSLNPHFRKTSETFSRPPSCYHKKHENSPANKTLRSTQPGSPISDLHKRVSPAAPKSLVIQRSNSLSIYNTLKDHKKNIFMNTSRNHEDLKTTTSGIESPKNAIRIVMSTSEPQPPQNGSPVANSILNFSPRKKLYVQGEKGPTKKKRMTMKELLVRSSSISVKPSNTFLTSPSFSPKKSSPPKNAVEIEFEEEDQDCESFDKKFKASFDKKLDIYNKFYTAYLYDPEVEFSTREDLKVKVNSLVSPKNMLTEGTTQFKTTKHMQTMHTMYSKSPLIPNKKSEDFSNFTLYADKVMANTNAGENTPQLKTGRTLKSKLREITASPTLDVKQRTVEERVNAIEKMFSEGREKAEELTQGLVNMQESLKQAGNLNEEQENFMLRIKEGKLFIVEAMLKKNPNLLTMRDPRNQTPLHWAVKRNQAAIVDFLCQQGADVEAMDIVGRSPFDIAKRFSNHKVVQALEAGREQQQIKKKLKIRSKLLKLGSLRTAVNVVRKIKQPT